MKKIFTKFFMLATLFLASTNLTAQTYNNGTWYSLYDATEYKNKDNTFSVFSPTTGSLSFQWKKTGWLFGYPIYKLSVSESSNGSNYTEKYSMNSGSGTKQENYVTVTTAVSENITHLKFKQSGSLDRFYKDIKIPLAKHILLNDGTSFGTTSVEKKFANSVTINETSSEIVTVKLRSFLTAGNISISSDNPAFYVATSTYAVGANACASANSAASSMAGGGTLGNINNYDVLIYFHPTSIGTHSGTITLTDGTSKATIKVSGTCTKKVQTIIWNDDIVNIKTTDNITLNATAATAISYTSSDNSIAEIVGNTLSIKKHGKVTITATAAETDIYASASQTKEVTISAATPEITWPQVAPITYGTPLTLDMLVGGTANVPGNFECSELPITLNAGTHKIAVRFVPENQNIYTIVEEKIDIIVNKADATITTIPNAINDLVYSGEEQILITEGSAEGGKIVYSLDGKTFTENVPTATNAGEYTVYYKVVGDENHNDVESANTIVVIIKKATLTITAEDKSVTYGEEAPTYSVAYSGWKAQDNEDVLVGEITFECEYNANSNVGTYDINISGVEAQNYEITFVSGVLIVNKADATITNTPNAINDLVYSGEEQILITEGKAEGGKIVYSLDGNTFTENVPTATNAGEYTVYYKVVGDENHNDVEGTNSIVVTIKKAILTITAEDKSVTYGEEVPTYSVAYSGWKAQDNEEVLVGEMTFECEYNIGSKVGTYTIHISGVEAQNYEITFVSGVLTVSKAEATITTIPNAINDLVYNGEEQKLITEGEANGGKMVYSLDGNTFEENIPTATNAGEYIVYYKVLGDENHNDIEVANTIVVSIQKATQSIIWDNHIDNIYTTDNITLIAIANTDIYYTSSDSTIAYVENATLVINKYGRVTITAIAKESNNYIRATESKDITISRATPTITWTITSDTLTIGNSIRLDAVASNNAEVLYEIIGEEGILQYDNQEKTLTAMVTGTTTVLAYTEENDIYEAAEYKYTITVILDSNPSTDITNTTINGEKAQKMFINGKLYIIRDNQWYDTAGKLVK